MGVKYSRNSRINIKYLENDRIRFKRQILK